MKRPLGLDDPMVESESRDIFGKTDQCIMCNRRLMKPKSLDFRYCERCIDKIKDTIVFKPLLPADKPERFGDYFDEVKEMGGIVDCYFTAEILKQRRN